MEAINTTLKKFPHACSKGDLVTMYLPQMSESYIIGEINTIIMNNRPNVVPADGSRPRVKRIFHKELMEFVAIHGIPYGYYDPSKNY